MPTFLLSITLALLATVAAAQPLEATPPTLDLGSIVGAPAVERVVSVRNPGTAPVQIRNVRLTPPLTVARMKATIPPGESVDVVIRLGTPRPPGPFEGQIAIGFADESLEPLLVDVRAVLVPELEFLPRPELVAVAETGSEGHDFIEIVNHRPTPLNITGIESAANRFTATLETLEAGRRYRVSLELRGRGETGRQTDTVLLRTDDPAQPLLRIPARTLVIDPVHTFPDRIDFGRLVISALGPEQLPRLESSVMVYQKDGTDFQVKASTDLPFLRLRAEKSAKFGDRWQVFYSVDRDRLVPGRVNGSILLETNDVRFPRVSVPVEATVE